MSSISVKEDTILVYRKATREIQNERKPQCTKYKIVLYQQLYQVGYWGIPTVHYLPLSRLPTLLSGRNKSASCPFQELQYRRRYSVVVAFQKTTVFGFHWKNQPTNMRLLSKSNWVLVIDSALLICQNLNCLLKIVYKNLLHVSKCISYSWCSP